MLKEYWLIGESFTFNDKQKHNTKMLIQNPDYIIIKRKLEEK